MRTHMQRLGLLLLALAVSAEGALAAAAEGGEKPTLLAIEPWAAITAFAVFLLLLFVLSKFAWGPMLAGLKAREARIQQALDEAAAAHTRARELIAQYEGRLDQARTEAAAIAEEGRKDALAIKADIETAGRQAAAESVARAQVEIDRAIATAWERLVRDAADLATAAAARIVGRELDAEGHAALVGDVVDSFVQSRAGRTS